MNIPSLSYNSARYYNLEAGGGGALQDAALQQLGELEAEHDPHGGMANDTPIDKPNDGRNGSNTGRRARFTTVFHTPRPTHVVQQAL